MKNKIISILIACLILLNCTPVFADTGTNIIVGSETIDETVLERKDYIFDYISDLFESEKEIHIDNNDVDYSKMIRKFIGLDIFEGNELTKSKMKEYTENQKTFYLLPVQHDGVTVISTLQIREPLSDETKEKISSENLEFYENQTGKWYISFAEIRPRAVDYYKDIVEKALVKNNIENSEVYFVGGVCSHIGLAAIICNDNPDDTRVLVLEQYEAETGAIDKADAFDSQIILDKDTLYTYDEIKAIVDEDKENRNSFTEESVGYIGSPTPTSDAPAADNNKIIIISAISGAAALAIAVAAICIVKKKKSTKVLDEN